MPIIINGTTLGSGNINGTSLNTVIFNNITVWTAGPPPYYDELKNGTTLNESQWLEFLNGGGIKYIINKNEQDSFLNKKIKINNTINATKTIWTIIDFNHDNTSNTCDVMLDASITTSGFGNSSLYKDSAIRTWLTGTYYSGFSSKIKNKLHTMNVASNGQTLSDKIKILSLTEARIVEEQAKTEGTGYKSLNYITRRRDTAYWTRTLVLDYVNNNKIWLVDTSGNSYKRHFSDTSWGVVPVIRFA